MQDISAFGTGLTVVSLSTFPQGFQVSEFADDVDPLKVEDVEAIGYEILYDGSLFSFQKGAATLISIGVIAGSQDDTNFKIMLQSAKGSGSGLLSVGGLSFDTSLVITYPDGSFAAFSNGSILKGPPANSVESSGRLKGNSYLFAFGAYQGAQSIGQVIAGAITAITGL